MPTVGKTTIGAGLAHSINKKFIDTDKLLEAREKMTPREIVKNFGEEVFMRIQEDVVLKSEFYDAVVATGGSVVYSKPSMEKLKRDGIVIYLMNSVDEIMTRLDSSRLIIGSKEEKFLNLYKQREELYRKYADVVIDCADKTVGEVVDRIKTEVM